VDTIIAPEGKRELMRARWGLVPAWWKKPLKELKLATFNARAETVTEKPSSSTPLSANNDNFGAQSACGRSA
jgi:putative SOS response-associated peptidase YedK